MSYIKLKPNEITHDNNYTHTIDIAHNNSNSNNGIINNDNIILNSSNSLINNNNNNNNNNNGLKNNLLNNINLLLNNYNKNNSSGGSNNSNRYYEIYKNNEEDEEFFNDDEDDDNEELCNMELEQLDKEDQERIKSDEIEYKDQLIIINLKNKKYFILKRNKRSSKFDYRINFNKIKPYMKRREYRSIIESISTFDPAIRVYLNIVQILFVVISILSGIFFSIYQTVLPTFMKFILISIPLASSILIVFIFPLKIKIIIEQTVQFHDHLNEKYNSLGLSFHPIFGKKECLSMGFFLCSVEQVELVVEYPK